MIILASTYVVLTLLWCKRYFDTGDGKYLALFALDGVFGTLAFAMVAR